jgi:predicted RND superfamily exporter protein
VNDFSSIIESRNAFFGAIFRFIIAKRWWVIGLYAILLALSIPFALLVKQDNAIDRLIVEDDPDFLASRDFAAVFGLGEYVVLFAEAANPFAKDVIAAVDSLDRKLQTIPNVTSNSLFAVYRKARPGADPSKNPAAFTAFAKGSDLFRRQGLVGAGFFGVPLILDVKNAKERAEVLRAVDAAVQSLVDHPAPLKALSKVGEPYVNDYLNTKSVEGGMRQFPIFGLFVVVLVLGLYRSLRALVAFVMVLAVNVALAVGVIGILGGTFTIVSALVPMTILVTCLATLVYIHSRFIERPLDRDVDDHLIFALSNKFPACTASIFATAAGFAALAVSDIRPIREMGIWLAVGLVITWILVFTLFPALVKVLKTPTQVERKTAAQWFGRLVNVLPLFSYRARFVTVGGALGLSVVGAVCLFGFPGIVRPMKMLTEPIEYVNSSTNLYKDTRRVEQLMPGLSTADLWLKGKVGTLEQPEVLAGLDDFQRALEREPLIGSAVGPTTVLRMARYVGGMGDKFPEDAVEIEALADSLSVLALQEKLLSRFIEIKNMAETHITLITRITDFQAYEVLGRKVDALWKAAVQKHPALLEFGPTGPKMVGMGRLQSKVSSNLVPTLTHSFILTVAIIFSVFLLVFRNGAARLMAMIPSLFAILVMFAIMRLAGMSLNVATILIASTVLGTSENDQIHFFYHFLEGRNLGGKMSTAAGLCHTMLIAGRSIFFATLINALGFLAFALSDLPPIRQFAILASSAFALSMIADFTALPGALWMIFRDKPDALKKQGIQ